MNDLRRVLSEPDTVLFIGSGLSRWAGLPSWPAMLEELAEFVEARGEDAGLIRSEIQRGDLLQSASYGFDKLTPQQIGEFIRAACRFGKAKPHEIHKRVVELGPRCYITTNYDNLIEESLRIWCPERFYRSPITNRHLTELAEIVHARATDFVFKPHGDAADCESIIMTREQYRCLLPQGDRHSALETLRMLLASRPVVYLGFGLRDPDFSYIRDLMANTYRGGIREHYAIMPDIADEEAAYWRRNYGIHLIGYESSEGTDGSRDHSALMHLLESLQPSDSKTRQSASFDPTSPEAILALTRYAASLMELPRAFPEFSLRVHHVDSKESRAHSWLPISDTYNHVQVGDFLDRGPHRSVLVGLPGAGKSYSMKQAVRRLAKQLHSDCLVEEQDFSNMLIPILADFKLYDGDLLSLLDRTLPEVLPLDQLLDCFKVKIFLDSFNEMPRDWWESSEYEADLARLDSKTGESALVISSRTIDGLGRLGFPIYRLDWIDEEHVSEELRQQEVSLNGSFQREIKSLLQRPFFFRQLISGRLDLGNDPHPNDFFSALLRDLDDSLEDKLGKSVDVERVLSVAAYDALDEGQEAFDQDLLLTQLDELLTAEGITDFSREDVANWLVSASIMVPYRGHRIAFVHQSVTEYLAARELARVYGSKPEVLRTKLELTRWDQALFLTLSLLDTEQAASFLDDVISVDLMLAMRAVKYLEVGQDEVVTRLLDAIPLEFSDFDRSAWEVANAIEMELPISSVHEDQLRLLIARHGTVGSAATRRLVQLRGIEVKDELLRLLVDRRGDYNFCSHGVGRSLRPLASREDIVTIVELVDSVLAEEPGEIESSDIRGFIVGSGAFLGDLPLSDVRNGLSMAVEDPRTSWLRGQVLSEVARQHHTTEALNLAAELLLLGVPGADFSLLMVCGFGSSERKPSWESITREHVESLLSLVAGSQESWSISVLENLCSARPDLADDVRAMAADFSGMTQAAMLQCVSADQTDLMEAALASLLAMDDEARSTQDLWDPERVSFDWSGKEQLYVDLLLLRDRRLTNAILGGGIPVSPKGFGQLNTGSLSALMDLLQEMPDQPNSAWVATGLGSLLAGHVCEKDLAELIAEISSEDSTHRDVFLRFVLPFIPNVSTDDLGDEVLDLMLADLLADGQYSTLLGDHLLGVLATESFVRERLLPLAAQADTRLNHKLRKALEEAGSRHGRRYVTRGGA